MSVIHLLRHTTTTEKKKNLCLDSTGSVCDPTIHIATYLPERGLSIAPQESDSRNIELLDNSPGKAATASKEHPQSDHGNCPRVRPFGTPATVLDVLNSLRPRLQSILKVMRRSSIFRPISMIIKSKLRTVAQSDYEFSPLRPM